MPRKNDSWGIEIGANAIKAMRLVRNGSRIELAEYDILPFKQILTTPDLNIEEAIQVNLDTFLSKHEVAKSTVVISVPGTAAFARFVKLPPVEPKKIPAIVKFEAVQQIPFPIDQVEWDYQTFQKEDSPDVEVGIFAIAKERLAGHLAHYRRVDMRVDAVTPSPLAVYNAFAHERAEETEPEGTIYMDIGTSCTDVIIAEGDTIWMRTLPIGGNNFTEALVRSFKLSYAKAERLKREAGTSKYARQIFQAMRPVFAELVQELQRSLGYYQSLHRESRLTKLVGVGSTFRLPGLQKYLKQQLQMEVTRPEGFKALEVEGRREAALADQAMNLFTAYGLAVQGLNIERISANLLPRQIQMQRMWKAKEPWVAAAAACIVAASGIAGGTLFTERAAYQGGVSEYEAAVEQTLNEAQQYQQRWNREKAEADPQGKIEILRGMLDYRNLWPRLAEDVTQAMMALRPQEPLLTGDYEAAARIPRNEWRRLFVDSIETRYIPRREEEGGGRGGRRGQQTELGRMVRASDFWPERGENQTIEEYFEQHQDRYDGGWRPPRFEIVVRGTTPNPNAHTLISNHVVRWLEDAAYRPDRPYRVVVDRREGEVLRERQVGDDARGRDRRPSGRGTPPGMGGMMEERGWSEPQPRETRQRPRSGGGSVPWEREAEDHGDAVRELSFDNLYPRRPEMVQPQPEDRYFELRWTVELYPPEMARQTQRDQPPPTAPPAQPDDAEEAPIDEVAARPRGDDDRTHEEDAS